MGTFLMRAESELVLKSRRVVPGRLVTAGFRFLFPEWHSAAQDLVARRRRNLNRGEMAGDFLLVSRMGMRGGKQ